MTDDHDYADTPNIAALSTFAESCVGYIAGYVVKMVKRTLKCNECLEALTINSISEYPSPSYSLIKTKKRGGLILPAQCGKSM